MIKLSHLTFSYIKGFKPAVDNADCRIGNGIHLLLGENGAGKTTLLHLIAGLLTPQKGECLINGENTALRSPDTMRRLFFLPDDGLNGLSNDSISGLVHRHAIFYPTFSAERLTECLGSFGLTGEEKLKNLSLGARKKSALSYAIALGTEVIMLDEPANGLDIDSKKTFQRLLATHITDEQSVIISTHTVSDFRNLFDGIIAMRRSRLLFAMDIPEITQRVAFVNHSIPTPDEIYREHTLNGLNAIIPNTGICSDIDFQLLYSALQGPAGDTLLKLLKS